MNYGELDAEIAKAAASVVNNWPGAIKADDLRNELWIKILESPRYQGQMEASEPALRMEFLRRMGRQIAGREVSSYELFSGNVFYSVDRVRGLLGVGMLTMSRRDLGGMWETLTDFIDLQDAFKHMQKVNPEYALAIWNNYVGGLVPDNGARERKLQRAVGSLTDYMNQVHRRRYAEYEDGPGTREVVSNSRARAMTATQWSGE